MSNYLIKCPQCGKINIKNNIPMENREYVSCIHCFAKYEERKAAVISALSEKEEKEYFEIFKMNTEMPVFIFNKLTAEQRNVVNKQNNQRLIEFINKLPI